MSNKIIYCGNCGEEGHTYRRCLSPIMSLGIILYKIDDGIIKYLFIQRKDTLGFVEFMRGKYNLENLDYIKDIFKIMTINERDKILKNNFDYLWNELWMNFNNKKFHNEYSSSKDKFYKLKDGINVQDEEYDFEKINNFVPKIYNETEWGFPKGRHNNQEKDMSCALREFEEETGISRTSINILYNVLPFEEIFTGSNYKSYKHKYYVAYMENDIELNDSYQHTEVSKIEWKTFDEAINLIRSYNLEKKDILTRVNTLITNYNSYDVK